MYLSIALANVAFTGFQWIVMSPWFKSLQERVVAFFGSAKRESAGGGDPLTRKWVLGLVIIAIGLAVLHMALMPRVPAWDLVVGFSDPLQPNYDREAADKFLPVPTLVRYVFDWNQGILFPILFAVTVLMRWRPAAVIVGVFGFIYVTGEIPVASLPRQPHRRPRGPRQPADLVASRDRGAGAQPARAAGGQSRSADLDEHSSNPAPGPTCQRHAGVRPVDHHTGTWV
jgi:hypothetical protein